MKIQLLKKPYNQTTLISLQFINSQGGSPDYDFNKHLIFVAKNNEDIIAFGALSQPHGFYFLRNCVVDNKFRGQGIQKELIKERLAYVKRHGGRNVKVRVDPNNTHSLNNLIASGFEHCGNKNINGIDHLELFMNL